jgi:hypothetical protein
LPVNNQGKPRLLAGFQFKKKTMFKIKNVEQYNSQVAHEFWEVGDIVVTEYGDVGYILDTYDRGEIRTDIIGNVDDESIRPALYHEIVNKRMDLINRMEPCKPLYCKDYTRMIEALSKHGIIIDMLADGYKLKDVALCYRGIVNYQTLLGTWTYEDVGCSGNYDQIFNECVETAKWLLSEKKII